MTKEELGLVLAKKAYMNCGGVLIYELIGQDKTDGSYVFVALQHDKLWLTETYERLLTDDFTIIMAEDVKRRY